MTYRFLSCSTRTTALNKLLVQKKPIFLIKVGGGGCRETGSVNIQWLLIVLTQQFCVNFLMEKFRNELGVKMNCQFYEVMTMFNHGFHPQQHWEHNKFEHQARSTSPGAQGQYLS